MFFQRHFGLAAIAIIASATNAFADYAAEVLADAPIAYWRLDDADGTSVADASGNAHDGAADGFEGSITFGEPGLLAAEPGNAAITLSGLDRILVPGFDKIGAAGYSAEYWIRMQGLPGGFLNLVGDGAGGGTFFMMNYTNASGIIRPHYSFANAPVSLDAAAGTLAVGPVYHVVTTWDAADPGNNNGKIYVNGVVVRQGNVSGNPDPANESHPVYIGRDDRENRAANFTIDEVALYDFPLSAERVVAHYTAGTGGVAPPMNYAEEVLSDAPLAYWRLGEAAGPAAADSSGNGHDATADPGVAFAQASLIPPDTDTAVGLTGDPGLASLGFEKFDTGSSIEFWTMFNAAPAGGAFSNLVGDAESENDFGHLVEAGGDGIIRAHVQTEVGTVSIGSTTSLVDERMHHVVSTWDAATGDLRLYIDNVEVGSANQPGDVGPANSDHPIFIGGGNRGPGTFDGIIDEVAVYDFPLAADRIASHFRWVDIPPPPKVAFGVEVGNSTLIGELHYSDSFTTTGNGGAEGRPGAGAFPVNLPGINVEDNHGNAPNSWTNGRWSIAEDATVNDPAGVFTGSGAGSATGMTQTGGGVDYGIPYGISDNFVLQCDAVQVPDRVNITASNTIDTIAGGLAVFFRTTGHPQFPEIGLYNGSSEIDSGLTSGIASKNEWHNYAVRFDLANSLIEVFVDEVSRGVVDLAALNGGSHNTASNAFLNVGNTSTDGARAWTDNFQVGAPGGAAPLAITDFLYDPATGDFTIIWNSRPDTNYGLDYSFDLKGWSELNDGLVSEGQSTSHTDNISDILPPGQKDAFFRIREL